MRRSEPSNEVCLAAELAAGCPVLRRTPFRAAVIAHELCSIGRAYKAVSERLCNGIANARGDWDAAGTDRAEKRRDMLKRKAEQAVKGLPVSIEGESIHLAAYTGASRFQTALL